MATPRNVSYTAASGQTVTSAVVVLAPTSATLSGPASLYAGVAGTYRVTLDRAADVAYTVTWTRTGGGTGAATSTIAAGQTWAEAATTWASAGSGSVDFTIAPGSLTCSGRPIAVAVQAQQVMAPSTKYRNAQPYLFSSISTPSIPDRLGGPPGYDLNISQLFGPMKQYVDWRTGWKWDNVGGDWIDATNTRMGTTTAASISTPAAGSAATYSVSVTAALQKVQTTGRWNAWIGRRAAGAVAARTWAARFHSTPEYRPRIEVTYTDTSTATLACRCSAFMGDGTSQPSQGAETFSMNAPAGVGALALEFDRPTKAVSSATMYFTVTNHWSASCVLQFDLADPPLNTSPVTTGVADAYPLDSGLSAEPSIIGSHRYMDGANILDFWWSTTVTTNHDMPWNFSTDVGGTGPNDATMLPRKGAGKFVPNSLYAAGSISLVSSSYSAESFTPLAPGMGAMRFTMSKAAGITDGFVGGDYGTAAINAYINMPVDKIDVIDRVFVRYYQMIGTTADTGNPYSINLAQKYEVIGSGPSVVKWTDMGGKFSISPCGKTPNGGNSGTSGGGGGWVLRPHWMDYWADTVAPGCGGWEMEFEWDDYQQNPAGYNYNVNTPPGFIGGKDFIGWGQKGGLASVMYAGRWYCIEEELKLNSVATINAQDGRYWQPDGEVRVWVDGRLVYEVTGAVMRTLPATDSPAGYIQIKHNGTDATQLGIKHLWFNWFHGGTTQNSIDRVAFITGLAWGTSRIGPMQIPSALPSWVPATPGQAVKHTVGAGVLTNNFRDVCAPWMSAFYDVATVNDYSGAVPAAKLGSHGALVFMGAGHAGSNTNQVTMLKSTPTQLSFVRLSNPTAWSGSQATDGATQYANSTTDITTLIDPQWLDAIPAVSAERAPPGIHTYTGGVMLDAVGPFGSYFNPFVGAAGTINANTAYATLGAAHTFTIASDSTPASNSWARAGSLPGFSTSGSQGPLIAAYCDTQNRTYYCVGNFGSAVRWFDHATGQHVVGNSSGFQIGGGGDYNAGQLIYVKSRELLLYVMRSPSATVQVQWMDVSGANPQLGGTATLSQTLALESFAVGKSYAWCWGFWCPDNNRLHVFGVKVAGAFDNTGMYEIEIPATLGSTWNVTRREITGSSGLDFSTYTWQPPQYLPAAKAMVWFPHANRASDGADSVFVYRPYGT